MNDKATEVSTEGAEVLIKISDSTYTVDTSPIDNGSVETWVDYPLTAKMRIQLAISKIQQYSSMAAFDDIFTAKTSAWFNYYTAIKSLTELGEFEEVFNVEIPSD